MLFFESHFLTDWRKKRTKNISANMEGVLSTTNVSDNLMGMSLNVRTLNIGYFCPQSVNVQSPSVLLIVISPFQNKESKLWSAWYNCPSEFWYWDSFNLAVFICDMHILLQFESIKCGHLQIGLHIIGIRIHRSSFFVE